MTITLNCKNKELLENAVGYLSKTVSFAALERHPVYKYVRFEMKPDNSGLLFLDELLEKFPELDISATVISEVEGRDSSWWSTTTYESITDENGRRVMKCTGGNTCWA